MSSNDPMVTGLMTAAEVARVLRVTPYRVYELIRRGDLPVVRLGRQVRVEVGSLDDWIKSGGKGLTTKSEAPSLT